MKRVDLHIHTNWTIKDRKLKNGEIYEFSLDFLKGYIEFASLDVIAITNHNEFDLNQFNQIKEELDIDVFPGVEVDLVGGHLLVIAPLERIDEFNEQCLKLKPLIVNQKSTIELSVFKEIFPNYRNYLLIPHYDKTPKLKNEIIADLEIITAGEVQSPKKFFYMKNNVDEKLTPVIFSDIRSYERSEEEDYHYPNRFTYMDINDVDIQSIKLALQDKHKIRITETDENEIFDIAPNGIKVSTKLNLVVGKRSTGKTYTLNRIVSSMQDDYGENIKYIKQFQIVNESADGDFDKILDSEKKEMLKDYLSPLKSLIDKVVHIDMLNAQESLGKFTNSLSDYADSQSLTDEYSKCTLFTESKYNAIYPHDIKELAESSYRLYIEKNDSYKEVIQKYVSNNSLKSLVQNFLDIYKEKLIEYRMKEKTDEIAEFVREALGELSAINPITDMDFSDYFIKYKTVDNFNVLIDKLNVSNDELLKKDLFRFDAILSKEPFQSVAPLKSNIKTNTSLTDALKYYKEKRYYSYLRKLIEIGVDSGILHYSLFNFKLEIRNKHNTPISHGERAEYNLLRNLENASRYDILLLDEPEASFDNVFIHKFVIPKIKELSNKLTVFLVTHNNTLGSSIKPDYIIYTDFDEIKFGTKTCSKEECFKIYSGSFDSRVLQSESKEEEKNYDALIRTMEAGETAYKERSMMYEDLKNK